MTPDWPARRGWMPSRRRRHSAASCRRCDAITRGEPAARPDAERCEAHPGPRQRAHSPSGEGRYRLASSMPRLNRIARDPAGKHRERLGVVALDHDPVPLPCTPWSASWTSSTSHPACSRKATRLAIERAEHRRLAGDHRDREATQIRQATRRAALQLVGRAAGGSNVSGAEATPQARSSPISGRLANGGPSHLDRDERGHLFGTGVGGEERARTARRSG